MVVLKSQVINSYYFYKYNFCVSAIDITIKILLALANYRKRLQTSYVKSCMHGYYICIHRRSFMKRKADYFSSQPYIDCICTCAFDNSNYCMTTSPTNITNNA